jgi:hypothetical protein
MAGKYLDKWEKASHVSIPCKKLLIAKLLHIEISRIVG